MNALIGFSRTLVAGVILTVVAQTVHAGDIAHATEEQMSASIETASAMSNVAEMTAASGQVMDHIKDVSDRIAETARELQELTGRFQT